MPFSLVPGERIEEDLAGVLRAVQHVRQQDPVVVAVRLVAEHDDVELLGAAARQDLLDGARAGHAVADDHELSLSIVAPASSSARLKSP